LPFRIPRIHALLHAYRGGCGRASKSENCVAVIGLTPLRSRAVCQPCLPLCRARVVQQELVVVGHCLVLGGKERIGVRLSRERCANVGAGKNVAPSRKVAAAASASSVLHAPEFLLDGVVQSGITGFLDALVANVEFLPLRHEGNSTPRWGGRKTYKTIRASCCLEYRDRKPAHLDANQTEGSNPESSGLEFVAIAIVVSVPG